MKRVSIEHSGDVKERAANSHGGRRGRFQSYVVACQQQGENGPMWVKLWMNLPWGPHSGSWAWLCDHCGDGNSKVTRNEARDMSRGWVMGGSVCPAREFELSPTVTIIRATPKIYWVLPVCQALFFVLCCINSFQPSSNPMRWVQLLSLFTNKEM